MSSNKDDDKITIGSLVAVAIICFLIGFISGYALSENSEDRRIISQLSSCVEKLPRDQYCTMVAVPSTFTIPKMEGK